ncbi:hypothetical protein BpHYR1_020462, partial [Brachionus plicatilis]
VPSNNRAIMLSTLNFSISDITFVFSLRFVSYHTKYAFMFFFYFALTPLWQYKRKKNSKKGCPKQRQYLPKTKPFANRPNFDTPKNFTTPEFGPHILQKLSSTFSLTHHNFITSADLLNNTYANTNFDKT